MNKLIIPPCPNWFETSVFTCAVDNTLIYGSMGNIVVIFTGPKDDAANVKFITNAHERVVAVSTNNDWNTDSKLLVSIGEEKNVRLWDINTFQLKKFHNLHKKSNSKLVGVAFATDDRIVSVSSDGLIVLWRPSLNETSSFNNIITDKSHVTCMSICPHATWLAAFGQNKGIIVVADLRKSGKVLYNLRCYDTSPIVSLSWSPTPFNIFPENKRVILKPKCRLDKKLATAKNEEETLSTLEVIGEKLSTIKLTDEKDHTINPLVEKEVPKEHINLPLCLESSETLEKRDLTEKKASKESENVKENPWINLKHADDDELNDSQSAVQVAKNIADEFDFLSECTALKYRILNEKEIEESEGIDGTGDVLDESGVSLVNTTDRESDINEENVNNSEVNVDFDVESFQSIGESLIKSEIENTLPAKKEFLLASSSKSGPILIWRAGTDGRVQLEMQTTKSRRNNSKKSLDKIWITIFWIKPNILLSSSATGELLLWDLLKYEGNGRNHKPSIIHCDHKPFLFAIAGRRFIRNSLSDTSLDNEHLTAWTIGQDRHIFETALDSKSTCVSSYLTLPSVHCMGGSSIDSNRIAVGLSDGSIVLWNLSLPHTRKIEMNRFYHKDNGKIVTLAWHPLIEHLLAYATNEGAVAILKTNIISSHGANSFLSSFFKSPVHKVEWGPLRGNTEKYALYACGEGKLVYYDVDVGKAAPVPIEFDDDIYVTHMSWKPDYTVLAIATKSSVTYLLSCAFEILSLIIVSQKTITQMLWHPTATFSSDADISPCANWLAIGTRAGQCAVYNMTRDTDQNEDASSLVNELNCHTKQILSIAWSPFDDGKLITSSEDGTAQIWNVESGIIINSYMSCNLDPIANVSWSPLKEDLIISTAKDVVQIWDCKDYPPKSARDIHESIDSLLKVKNKYRVRNQEIEQSQAKQAEESCSKSKKKTLLPKLAKAQNDVSQALADCKKLLENSRNDNEIVTQLFGNKEDVCKMLTNQQHLHMKSNKFESGQYLSLWKGDFIDTIKSAIDNGTVTPWLICMAPMISPQLWQEACRSFAKKQSEESEDSDPTVTASFFLACHDVQSAVNVLSEAGMFREAVSVIKCRLVADSSIYSETLKSILEKWAIHSIITGSYEIAAQCYLALGNYDEAAKALFKRSDEKSLRVAQDIANKGDNDNLKLAITCRLDWFVKCEISGELKSTKSGENALEELDDDVSIGGDSKVKEVAVIEVNGAITMGENIEEESVLKQEENEKTMMDLKVEGEITRNENIEGENRKVREEQEV